MLTLTLGMLATGCRFGNYNEKEKGDQTTSLILGTEPQAFTTAVLYNDFDTNGEQNMDANDHTPLTGIPNYLTSTITHPVEFIHLNEYSNSFADAMFRALDGSSRMAAKYKQDGSVQGGGYLSARNINNCVTTESISFDGKINFNLIETFTDLDGKTKKTNGRLKNSVFYNREFDGDCFAVLKRFAACYQNPAGAGCSQDEINFAVDLYHLYVNYAGILNLNDATLQRLHSLVYIVDYE